LGVMRSRVSLEGAWGHFCGNENKNKEGQPTGLEKRKEKGRSPHKGTPSSAFALMPNILETRCDALDCFAVCGSFPYPGAPPKKFEIRREARPTTVLGRSTHIRRSVITKKQGHLLVSLAQVRGRRRRKGGSGGKPAAISSR